ncbi:hypothetical protein MSPP1_004017 [Malassezia sp. CBS 17886]|nr:hypothetical protein MSPP1_004017 [Malassezia sp. CBS 17886]
MCIALWTTVDPEYSLYVTRSCPGAPTNTRSILADNRDEFLARRAVDAAWHGQGETMVLSGRDVEAGGTWFGVARNGAFGVLTNYTEYAPSKPRADGQPFLSRGELVSKWLQEAGACDSPRDVMAPFLAALDTRKDLYNGFNLLIGDVGAPGASDIHLGYLTNRGDDRFSGETFPATEPVNGMSNSTLATPWAKVDEGASLMHALALRRTHSGDARQQYGAPSSCGMDVAEDVFRILSTTSGLVTKREEMQKTVHVAPFEVPSSADHTRLEHPPANAGRVGWYGTRTGTVLLVTREAPRRATFVERDMYTLDSAGRPQRAKGPAHERRYEWALDR